MLAPTFHPHRKTRVAMGREKKGSQAGVFSFEGYMLCGECEKLQKTQLETCLCNSHFVLFADIVIKKS